MDVIRTIYQLFVICGCWRPSSWSTPVKRFTYTVYYLYILFLLFTATFGQFMDLVLNGGTQDEFSETFYLFVSMLVACHKMRQMLNSRQNIILMADMLESDPFLPKTEEGFQIRKKCIEKTESNTFYYALFIELSVSVFSLSGLLKGELQTLPYRIWLPYKYTSLLMYIFIYVQQILSLISGSLIHVACDSMIWTLLMHTYSQIDIFRCCLKMIKHDEQKMAKFCVRYHNLVYRFATMINEEFKSVIFVQFTMSTLGICFNLYLITGVAVTTARLLQIVSYSFCMFTQIYIFCWYGNEVKLKSLDISNTIFGLDWTPFQNNTKRDLLMIMMRSRLPIEIKSIHVVSLNLESFVALLKTSYSAYNVLQRRQR